MTDEFTVRIARTLKEVQSLLEVGFEYVGRKTFSHTSGSASKNVYLATVKFYVARQLCRLWRYHPNYSRNFLFFAFACECI